MNAKRYSPTRLSALMAITIGLQMLWFASPVHAFEAIRLSREVDSVRISPNGRYAACWSIANSEVLLLIQMDPLAEVGRIVLKPAGERVSGVAFDDEWLILKTESSLQTYRLSQFDSSESQPEPFATTTTDSPSNLVVPVGIARADGLNATEVYLGQQGEDQTVRYSLPNLDPLPLRFSSLLDYRPPMQFGSSWLIEGCHYEDPSKPPTALYWRPRKGKSFVRFSQARSHLSPPRAMVDARQGFDMPEADIRSSRTLVPYDGSVLITAFRSAEKEAFIRVYDRESKALIHESDLGIQPTLPMSLSSTSWINIFRTTPARFVIAMNRGLITDAWSPPEVPGQPLQIQQVFPTRLVLQRNSQARLKVIGGVPPYEIRVNNARIRGDTVRFDSEALIQQAQQSGTVNEEQKQAIESAFRVLAGRGAKDTILEVVTDVVVKDAKGQSAAASFVTLVEVPRGLAWERQQQEQERKLAQLEAQRAQAAKNPIKETKGTRFDLTGISPIPFAIMLMIVPVLIYCGAWYWQSRNSSADPSQAPSKSESFFAFSELAKTILYFTAAIVFMIGIAILGVSLTRGNIRVSSIWVSTAFTMIGSGVLLFLTPTLLPRRGGLVLMAAIGCIGFSFWCYFNQHSGLGGIWAGGIGLAGLVAAMIGIIMLTHSDPAAVQHSAASHRPADAHPAARQRSAQLRPAEDRTGPASEAIETVDQQTAESQMADGIASLGSRFGAYLIDSLLILIPVTVVCWIPLGFGEAMSERFSNPDDVEAQVNFLVARNRIRDLSFLVYIVYCIFLEASALQGTLGKRAVLVRVCDIHGNRITLGRSLSRNLSKILSYAICGIGFLIAFGSDRKQTLHDLIAGTVVMKRDPSSGS